HCVYSDSPTGIKFATWKHKLPESILAGCRCVGRRLSSVCSRMCLQRFPSQRRMDIMRVRLGLFLVLLLALSVAPAFAQMETGRITGTVYDQQDHVVPGVNVTATQTATGTSRSAVTDAEGTYVRAHLQPAASELKFTRSGFKVVSMKMQVQVGAALNADAKLEVGGTSETVTVAATPEVINTANAEVSTVIRADEI